MPESPAVKAGSVVFGRYEWVGTKELESGSPVAEVTGVAGFVGVDEVESIFLEMCSFYKLEFCAVVKHYCYKTWK
jgi:hypothetical protein